MRSRATHRTSLVAAGMAAGMAACTITAAVALANAPAARAALPGWSAAGTPTGAVTATTPMSVQVWLTPRTAAAEQFATAVSTPGNAQFRHYLSPAAYRARFGATPAQAARVTSWLRAAGLHGVHADAGRQAVTAQGPASALQRAFGVRLQRFRTGVRDTDRPASVPAALAGDVLGVTGLSTAPPAAAATARTASPTCSQYWGQHVHAVTPAYRGLTRASLPICGYSAGQLRSAYGATSRATGKGVTVALTESEAPTRMPQTLAEYARRNHLPAPRTGQFRQITSTAGGGSCDTTSASRAAAMYDDESEMDSEAVYAMAPDAHQLMVVGRGCTEEQQLLNAVLTVLDGDGRHPSASIVSNSWQLFEGDVPAATLHAIDVRAVAEGVGLYFASGDAPGQTGTAQDPFVTAVGGTSLGLDAHGRRLFETGWSLDEAVAEHGRWSDLGQGPAAGGGVSDTYRQPAYQRGVVPASMSRTRQGKGYVSNRVGPDIAADGDLTTGMLTGYTDTSGRTPRYVSMVNAGTSLATPLIAGLVADAQQGLRTALGFVNPLLYRMARTRAVLDVLPIGARTPALYRGSYSPAQGSDPASVTLFDHQGSGTDQVTAKGYDTMTGVGTPNGAKFLAALRSTGR